MVLTPDQTPLLKSKMQSSGMSYGRGGAGNIGPDRRPSVTTEDLQTPTIKSATYTTGRGGSGNMAHADPENPERARTSQDVGPQPVREPEGKFHFGRGGAANVTTMSKEEQDAAREHNKTVEKDTKNRGASFGSTTSEGQAEKKGILEKLGLGGDKK